MGRPPIGKTAMSDVERQRRWRERRNALAREAEIARLPKPWRRRKAKLVGDHRDQTNAFIGELGEFNIDYCHRLEAWLAIAEIDDKDREALWAALHFAANELSTRAHGELVAGVDFASPEPIASVLPRIQLTNSEEEELWALVCKGRRRNPNNDDDAAMAKEIFETVDLTNAVQQALQFYVRDVAYRVEFPKVRSELKTLQSKVARFLDVLPQEHDPVGYFLRRTYTGEIFLKDQLRPTDEKFGELKQAWSAKHGFDALRNSLSESQRNIDCAASLLSGTRPPNMAVNRFVRSLAYAWKAATGCWPKSGRDPHNASRQSGPFAEFVRAVYGLLPSEYRNNAPLDHAIRSVCAQQAAAGESEGA